MDIKLDMKKQQQRAELEKFIPVFLKSWRKGGEVPAELLQMFSFSSEDKFRDWINRIVFKHLPEQLQAVANDLRLRTMLENQGIELFGQYSKEEREWAALYLRYFSVQKIKVEELAKYIGYSSKQFRRYVNDGMNLLLIDLLNHPLLSSSTKAHLATDMHLVYLDTTMPIGIDVHTKRVATYLADRSVSIEGVGGIGKTTLAREVIGRDDIQCMFDEIIWVSAKQEWLSADGSLHLIEDSTQTLEDLLLKLADQLGLSDVIGASADDISHKIKLAAASRKCLIVVDNLETVNEVNKIVPLFLSFASKFSRILFTSRKTLYAFPSIQVFSVPVLSYENSKLLVERELQRRSKDVELSNEVFAQIHEHAGGVPIALTLIAAQLGRLSPKIILDGFKNHEQLFTFIYRQAWLGLDDVAIRLLLSMLFISPDGADEHWVFANSKLTVAEFQQGIEQLLYHSLVEISGTVRNPVYRLHRLTITFLRSEILESW